MGDKNITFLIDSGSDTNCLRESCLPDDVKSLIDKTKIVKLNGIYPLPIYTLGTLVLKLFDKHVTFNIVTDQFSIPQQGIIGSKVFM